jgi:hypothetical protein
VNPAKSFGGSTGFTPALTAVDPEGVVSASMAGGRFVPGPVVASDRTGNRVDGISVGVVDILAGVAGVPIARFGVA